MKKKIGNYLLSFLLIFLLIRCSFDHLENDLNQTKGFTSKTKVNLLKGKEAKKVYDKLINYAEKNSKLKLHKSGTILAKGGTATIDYSQVMEVIDTLGNYNYTFRIINHPEDDYNTFHNLLVNFDENSEVYWIKYDNTLDNKDFGNETTMTYEKLTSSVPCDPITTNPSNGSSPGGGDAGVGIGTTPGGGDSGSSGGSGGSGSGSGGGTGGSSGSGTGSSDFPEFEAPDDPCTYVTLNWCIENAPSNIDETFSLRVEDCSCLWSRSSRYYRTANGDLIITNVSSFLPNPCDPPGDIGVLLPGNKPPCEVLKEMMDPLKYNAQSYINNLKNMLPNANVEYAYSFKREMDPSTGTYNYPTQPLNTGNQTSVDISTGFNFFGGIHLHTKDLYSTFSFGDLVFLSDATTANYNASNGVINDNEVVLMLVSANPENPNNPSVKSLVVNDRFALSYKVNQMLEDPKLVDQNLTKEDKIKELNRFLYLEYKNDHAKFLKKFEGFGFSMYDYYQPNANSTGEWRKATTAILNNQSVILYLSDGYCN